MVGVPLKFRKNMNLEAAAHGYSSKQVLLKITQIWRVFVGEIWNL